MASDAGGGKTSRNVHEDICRKCGKCCRRKAIIGGRVVYLPHYCKYLDVNTKLCTVYHRRFEVNSACKSIEEAIRMRILPADCVYVRGIKGYRGPVEEWESPEAEEIFRRLAIEHDDTDLTAAPG